MPVDAKSGEYQRFREQIESLPLPPEVREPVERELEKFALMDPNASEFIVTRNYLDTVVSLPWAEPEAEEFELEESRKILDADHYGLDEVKERIIEFLAVRKTQERHKRLDNLPGRRSGSRQDISREIDCPRSQ